MVDEPSLPPPQDTLRSSKIPTFASDSTESVMILGKPRADETNVRCLRTRLARSEGVDYRVEGSGDGYFGNHYTPTSVVVKFKPLSDLYTDWINIRLMSRPCRLGYLSPRSCYEYDSPAGTISRQISCRWKRKIQWSTSSSIENSVVQVL